MDYFGKLLLNKKMESELENDDEMEKWWKERGKQILMKRKGNTNSLLKLRENDLVFINNWIEKKINCRYELVIFCS